MAQRVVADGGNCRYDRQSRGDSLSNEKLRKGIGWGLVAVLSPVILLIAALCSIGTGGADHNNQAVAAAFYGTSYSAEVPMAFRSHIEDMRTAFSLLDSAVASRQWADGRRKQP